MRVGYSGSDGSSSSESGGGGEDAKGSPGSNDCFLVSDAAVERFGMDVRELIGRDGEFYLETPESVLTCRVRLRVADDRPVFQIIGAALTVFRDNELATTLESCVTTTSIAALTSMRSPSPNEAPAVVVQPTSLATSGKAKRNQMVERFHNSMRRHSYEGGSSGDDSSD